MKKIMTFAIALTAIAVSYFGAHALVYFSLVRFFAIGERYRAIVALIVLLLAASYFLATYLSHIKDNVWTRSFYFLSGTWVGLLVNLLFTFILVWFMVYVASFFTQIPLEKNLAVLAIGFSVLFSIYGMWNAFHPVVKNVQVKLSNLPENWKGKKIVQLSDVHLGHIYTAAYMDKIADQVNALDPDVIVITGDLFDGTDGKLDSFVAPLNKLKAKEGIFYVTGNHETYLGISKALSTISQTDITVLRDDVKDVNGLQFLGIDYPERMETKDIDAVIAKMKNFDKQKPSVLLWHIPTQIEQAKNAGISLMLSGHTHRGQLFPFQFITSAVFHGYDYGLKQDGNFHIYTSSGLGSWGTPMRTENRSEIVEITLN